MKYLQLFVFPAGLAAYGLLFAEKREGYQMIEGAILTILAVGGSIVAAVIAYVTRKMKWSDSWYARVGIGILGCVVAYVLLFVYVQIIELPGVQKDTSSPLY